MGSRGRAQNAPPHTGQGRSREGNPMSERNANGVVNAPIQMSDSTDSPMADSRSPTPDSARADGASRRGALQYFRFQPDKEPAHEHQTHSRRAGGPGRRPGARR